MARALGAMVVTAVVAGGPLAGVGSAGSYQVKSCLAGGQFSPQAFVYSRRDATRGMGFRRECDVEKNIRLKGIIAGEAGGGLRPRGSRATIRLYAPAGTKITSIDWRGNAKRTDCGWELAVFGADGRKAVGTVEKVAAGRYRNGHVCDRKPRLEVTSSHYPRHTAFAQGATKVVQRILCRGYYRRYCSAKGSNYIRTLSSRVTIRDDTPPAVQVTGGSLFNGWVNGRRDVRFSASDAVGIQSVRAVDQEGRTVGFSGDRPCDFSSTAPCPNTPGTVSVDTTATPREGTQPVALRGYDSAGNIGSATAMAHIDNSPPGRVDLGVDGGDGWDRSNAFTVRWQNPPEPDRAPISAAHYRICRADGKHCSNELHRRGTGISELSGVSVPGPGEWRLSMWREDEAGNLEDDNASVPVNLRYDPDPPGLAFEPVSSADPTRLSVVVNENVSGLAGGQIEMSKEGSGTWQDVPTQSDAGHLLARLDDSRVAPGTYLVRAHAVDRAGNQAATDRKADGSSMVLTLPLRVRSAMRAGLLRRPLVRRTIRRGGKRHVTRRRVSRLVPKGRVQLGRVVRLTGQLRDTQRRPLVGQTVYVGAQTEGQPERLAGTVRTDSRGRYRYLTRAARNTTFRLLYLGTATVLPAQSQVTLVVPAKTSFGARDRHLLNGQQARFHGSLPRSPIPSGGKLVELQVKLTGHWQTFRTVKTDVRGRWRMTYTFRRTSGVQRYEFRARIPREAGYPFEAGRSRVLSIRVRGGR